MTTYEELLKEVQIKLDAFSIRTAKEYIPKLWEALKNENPNLTREDLRDKIEKDCLETWSERRILEALPDEAKDPKKQEFGRLSQKKRISAAETAAPLIQKKKEIIIDTAGKPIENDSTLTATGCVSPSSSDRKENQLHNNEGYFKFEFSIPIVDIWKSMLQLMAWNEDMIWLDVAFDKRTGHVISASIGEKSRQIIDEKSQEYIKNSKPDFLAKSL